MSANVILTMNHSFSINPSLTSEGFTFLVEGNCQDIFSQDFAYEKNLLLSTYISGTINRQSGIYSDLSEYSEKERNEMRRIKLCH